MLLRVVVMDTGGEKKKVELRLPLSTYDDRRGRGNQNFKSITSIMLRGINIFAISI